MGSGPSKLGVKRVAIGDWRRNEIEIRREKI
jgi:hypothetical protein